MSSIPKIIHQIWIGSNELNTKILKALLEKFKNTLNLFTPFRISNAK